MPGLGPGEWDAAVITDLEAPLATYRDVVTTIPAQRVFAPRVLGIDSYVNGSAPAQ